MSEWRVVETRRDLPPQEARVLFCRKLEDGRDFYFFGKLIDSQTILRLLDGVELDWWLVCRWRFPNDNEQY